MKHVGYCNACRSKYWSNRPGRGIATIAKGARTTYSGGVPSLKYFAARKVLNRSLFKYKQPKHNHLVKSVRFSKKNSVHSKGYKYKRRR